MQSAVTFVHITSQIWLCFTIYPVQQMFSTFLMLLVQHKFQFRFTERMKLSRVLHVNSNRFYVIPFCCWNSQKVTTLLVFKLTLEPSEESRTDANVLHELPTWLTWIIFLCANLCIILRMPIFLTCRKVHTRTHTQLSWVWQRVLFGCCCCCCSAAGTCFTRTEMQMSYSKGWQKSSRVRERDKERQRGVHTGRRVRHVWHIAQLT